MPAETMNYEGKPRRVGIEIEFGSVSALEAAQHIQSLYGGEQVNESKYRVKIKNTELGDFLTELDFSYVHQHAEENPKDPLQPVRQKLRDFIGSASSMIVPSEIVCPPIEFKDISKIEDLIKCLANAGASGTSDNPLYGFGFQLNPEIASREAEYITRILKAYLLLSDWLRSVIRLDITRQISAFSDPFPKKYIEKVVAPEYWPDMEQLISDYLEDNPTRNREFDMLPLFSWLNEDLVGNYVNDMRIKERPTFHYRLPNADINQPDWSLQKEWNRWCVVEKLSADRDKLNKMGSEYIDNRGKLIADNWAIRASEWMIL